MGSCPLAILYCLFPGGYGLFGISLLPVRYGLFPMGYSPVGYSAVGYSLLAIPYW